MTPMKILFGLLSILSQSDRCSSVFELSSDSIRFEGGKLTLSIASGKFVWPPQSALGRFKLYWTSDSLHRFVDPRDIAIGLVRDAYGRPPKSFRVLMANAMLSSLRRDTNTDMIAGMVAPVLSLRPNNSQALRFFAKQVLARQPEMTDPWFKILESTAKSISNVESQETIHGMMFRQQILSGDNLFGVDRSRSFKAYSWSLSLQPDAFPRHANLSSTHRFLGHVREAEYHALQGLDVNHNDAWSWAHLAYLRSNQNHQHRQALRLHLRSLELENSHWEIRASAALAMVNGDFEVASAIAEKWILGNEPDALLVAALSNAELGRHSKAKERIDQLVKLMPDDALYRIEELCLLQLRNENGQLASEIDAIVEQQGELAKEIQKSLPANLFETGKYVSPMVHQISFKRMIAWALAERDSDTIGNWRNAALADLSVEDWQAARDSVVRAIDVSGNSGAVESTLMAACNGSSTTGQPQKSRWKPL